MRAPVLVLGVAIAFNSMATDFVSPESPNDFGKPNSVLDDKLSWYQSHWQKIKEDYYACQNDIDRRIIRNKYISFKLEILNELYRKFESNTHGRSTALSATNDTIATGIGVAGAAAGTTVLGRIAAAAGTIFLGTSKRLYDGFEIQLTLAKIRMLREETIQRILEGKNRDTVIYDLIDAEQDLNSLELNSMLSAASAAVTKIKDEAMKSANTPSDKTSTSKASTGNGPVLQSRGASQPI